MKIEAQALAIAQKIKQRMAELKHPPLDQLETLDPKDARFFYEEANKFYAMRLEEGVTVEERHIERRDHPALAIRIYRPSTHKNTDAPLPILVYLQGGGWMLGNLDIADDACSFFAKQANCIVVSVDYRRSPEHKYPLPIIDTLDAVQWTDKQAENLGGDRHKIILGGESAGGNLAAVAAIKLRDENQIKLVGQLLITPVTQYGFDTPSYKAGHRFGLSIEAMHWF